MDRLTTVNLGNALTVEEINSMDKMEMRAMLRGLALLGHTLAVVVVPTREMEDIKPARYVLMFDGRRHPEFSMTREEGTYFPTKIDFIRGIRNAATLGLKESKELFEKGAYESPVRMFVSPSREEVAQFRTSLIEQIVGTSNSMRHAIPTLMTMFQIVTE